MQRSSMGLVAEHKSVRWDENSTHHASTRVAERWQHTFAVSHLPWAVTIDDEAGSSNGFHNCAFRRLDDLTLVDCVCDPCCGMRDESQLAATAGEFAVLVFISSGSETLHQRGEDLQLRSGHVFIWDSALPATFRIHRRLSKRSLVIPRTVLGVVGRRRVSGAVRLDGGAGAVRLLSSYIGMLCRANFAFDGPSASSARNASIELLLAALRTGDVPASGLTREALRDQMIQYIDDHLGGTEITPAELAAAHSISERTVQRVFKESGETVGDVVRRHRLRRARQDVIDGELSLSAIAHRWGYADLSHFTRTFKAMYGYPPSQLRVQLA